MTPFEVIAKVENETNSFVGTREGPPTFGQHQARVVIDALHAAGFEIIRKDKAN